LEKRQNSYKFPVIPARISEVSGISGGNFGGPRFPGIPEREFTGIFGGLAINHSIKTIVSIRCETRKPIKLQ